MSLLKASSHVQAYLDGKAPLNAEDLRVLVLAAQLSARIMVEEQAGSHEADVKWRRPGPHKELFELLHPAPKVLAVGDGNATPFSQRRAADPKKNTPLRLFNGRGYILVGGPDPRLAVVRDCPHVYLAAYSRADAARLIAEYLGREPRGTETEIRNYWNADAWGARMDGILPERGIWAVFKELEKPIRLF